MNDATKQYWTEDDIAALKDVVTLSELHLIGARVLGRMPSPIVQVCGPISTGGFGSIIANMQAFTETIQALQGKGLSVFDQMPFEVPMQKLKLHLAPGEYLEAILTDFYQPLFESKKINAFYFMPDWQSSHGALWEHEQALKLGIDIVYL
jgi:hypothetical protein